MNKKLATVSLGCASLLAANAQLRVRPHFTIGTAQVARTIAAKFVDRGIQITEEQVTLPVNVLANEENPALEVSAVQTLGRLRADHPGQASAGVKMKCKTAGACLPFYAVVTWPAPFEAPAGPATLTAAALVRNKPALPKTVIAGAHVTLVMEADHANIRLQAISLGSAAIGEQIRVASPDRKHVYQAVVVDAGLVKGSF